MSKAFIPGDSPAEKNRNHFTPAFKDSAPSPASFRVEWPRFQAGGRDFLSDPSLKEIEAEVLRKAKEKALLIEREAYDRGFAQGEKDGLELGQKRSETIFHQLQLLLGEMARQREDLYQAHTREMLQLVFCLTRKILQQDLPLPEPVIHKTLQVAFRYVKEQRKVHLHLNPSDYEYLIARPQLLPFAQEPDGAEGVKMIADPLITRGGCYLETSMGDIDATLESQLDQMASLIWEKVEKSGFHPTRLPE